MSSRESRYLLLFSLLSLFFSNLFFFLPLFFSLISFFFWFQFAGIYPENYRLCTNYCFQRFAGLSPHPLPLIIGFAYEANGERSPFVHTTYLSLNLRSTTTTKGRRNQTSRTGSRNLCIAIKQRNAGSVYLSIEEFKKRGHWYAILFSHDTSLLFWCVNEKRRSCLSRYLPCRC